ncbi:MAG TPA: photosynthetic reaction center cytochrome c subunit family protein [Candidatus Acidoferrales bacterium]
MNKTNSLRNVPGLMRILPLAVVALCTTGLTLHAQGPAAGPPAPAPSAADMKGKTAEQVYKKIEALKGIPADQVHPAMEYITTALGVGCGYCHVVGHFDQDDKREKHVARSMMQMTLAMNNTVFDGKREITCYTCHHGVAKAAATMLLPGDKAPTDPSGMEIFPALVLKNYSSIDANMSPSKAPATIMTGPAPAPKPAAAPLPSIADVFSKYEQALGGKAAIEKVTALSFKGSVDMMVPPPPGPPGTPPGPAAMGTVPAEHYVKGNKGVISWTFPGRPMVAMGYDGNIAWHGAPLREDVGDEARMLVELGVKFPGLEFQEYHTNVQVDAMEKIGDRDTYRVVGTRKNGFAVLDRLNFDAQTGLLVKSYTTMQSVIGGFPEDTFYEDYRDAGGVKVPYTMRVVSAEGTQIFKWSQVDANAPAEDARFMKPAPPAPRPPAD